jgi:hypothetical protein
MGMGEKREEGRQTGRFVHSFFLDTVLGESKV